MPPYFTSLRRKLGVLTLVLACVFAAGWMRSRAKSDVFIRQNSVVKDFILSEASTLTFARVTAIQGEQTQPATWTFFGENYSWNSGEIGRVAVFKPEMYDFEYWWYWGDFTFGAGQTKIGRIPSYHITYSTVPYWSIDIPLTLLSAWLLLSKPRSKNHQQ